MSKQVVYRNLFSMGTRLDLIFREVTDEQADSACLLLRNQLDRLENQISIYRDESLFSLINKQGMKAEFRLDLEMSKLFSDLFEMNNRTHGLFDFSLGKISSSAMTMKEISDYLSLNMNEKISLNLENNSIKMLHRDAWLDSGSFGKGYALDSIKKILKSTNINHTFISFGGSSVMASGHHSAADYWAAGIQDFRDEKKNLYVFELRDSSLSTSGNTLNNRKKYPDGHIVNPRTGKRTGSLRQLSISGESAFICEILSTALFVADQDEVNEILKAFPGYLAVEFTYDEEKGNISIKEYSLNE